MSSLAIRRAAPANPVNAAVTTSQIFPLTSAPLVPVTVGAPGKLAIEGKRFTVRAEGNVLTAGAFTVLATLYAKIAIPASPFTPGSWTLIGAGTARAVGTTYSPWYIQADCQFDSVSGIMHGTFRQLMNNLYDADAALTATITGINGSNTQLAAGNTAAPTDPAVTFAVGVTFNTGNTGNIGNLFNFEIGF